MDIIKSDKLARTEKAHAFYALEAAGTEEAKGVLLGALDDLELDYGDRTRAAVALADVANPTDEVVQALASASQWQAGDEKDDGLADFQNTALLALGKMVSSTAEAHPALSEAAKTEILGKLAQADVPLRLGAAVAAVGNTDDVAMWSEIAQQLDHDNAYIRITAATSAGQLQPPGIWQTMLGKLGTETDPSVRLAMLKSLLQAGLVPEGEVAGVIALMQSEADPKTRVLLVKLLGMLEDNAIAKAALVEQLKGEKDMIVLVEIGKYVDAAKHL